MELKDIKGLGGKRVEKLNKAGIFTPADLLLYFPSKYIDTGNLASDTETLSEGEAAVFRAVVVSASAPTYIKSRFVIVRSVFESSTGAKISCTWFNNKFIYNSLSEGREFFVAGKIKKHKTGIEIVNPSLFACGKSPSIIPVYKNIKGLPSNILADAMKSAIKHINAESYIPAGLAEKYGMIELGDALRAIHQPKSMTEVISAKRTMLLERMSYSLAMFSLLKNSREGRRVFVYKNKRKKLEAAITTLPFELTEYQNKCINEIIDTLHSDSRMNRLLQGDVGSGKTIVAFLTMYYAFLNGYQSVIMAPTEILARQHYKNAIKLFEHLGVRCCLLTSSMTRNEQEDVRFNIENGAADFIIGTHSLLSDNVQFKKLSLVITDEQHRFGVGQRGNLENKSEGTDSLVMSATPIPRSLALILYGELQQSIVEAKPKASTKVFTRYVPESKLKGMYDYVLDKAKEGQQTFMVCPRIEVEDDNIVSAESLYSELKKTKLKPYVALLHGKMKSQDRDAVMRDFYDGKIMVLVSTTVIEVGLDVPSATTMVIFNPERYGLSQLHQLRGRIGRGEKDGYCFLAVGKKSDNPERLDFFIGCSDGFRLAEYDFEQRGAGDFLGTRQHGLSGSFTDLKIDTDIIRVSKEISQELVRSGMLAGDIDFMDDENSKFIKALTLN